jgi:hypothetical protein
MIKLKSLLNEVKLTDVESDVAALYAWDGIKTNYGPNSVKEYGQNIVDMAIKLAPKVLAYQKKLKSIGKDIKNSKEAEILKAMISFSKSHRLNLNTDVSIEDLFNEARDSAGNEYPEYDDVKAAVRKVIQSDEVERTLRGRVVAYLQKERGFTGAGNTNSQRLYDKVINDLLKH